MAIIPVCNRYLNISSSGVHIYENRSAGVASDTASIYK